MNEILTQLRAAWYGMSLKQRSTLVMSGLATAGAVMAIVWWARLPTWSTLYTNLDPKDAQAVVQELQTRKTAFRLTNGGASVEVPIDQVDALRMALAAKNLPGSGRFGFLEMFGQDTIAQSDRTQRMRYQKAHEDELSRTIESLEEVRSARVHLVLPGERVFLDDQDASKASVTLALNRSAVPSADEVRSIVHIVSGAVQGLAPERVSVVDTAGHTLWEGDGASGGLITARQGEMKHGVEKDIETKVARVLEPLVGPDHFVVRTSADMDFQKVMRKERNIDPDSGAIISEQKSKERSSSSAPSTAGVPGTASNLPGGQGATTSGNGSDSQQSDTTTNNYEYSVVERTVEEPVGTVKRLSVAVLVDQAVKEGTPVPGAPRQTTPRTPEELKRIEQLVKAAISFSTERGDVVTVEQAPFAQPVEAAPVAFDWKQYLPYVKYPMLLVLLLMAFLLFYRPFVKTARDAVSRSPSRRPAAAGGAAPGAAAKAEVETQLLGPASQVEMLRQRLAKLAAEQPTGMAQTVRVWLHEPKEQG
jgi:flagellar M-ring protein FliF